MPFEFDRGVAAGSNYDEDGFEGIQVTTYGDAGSPFGEVQLPTGFYSRPCDPDLDAAGLPKPASSCQVIYVWDGARLHVLPMQDPRIIPHLPKLAPGSSVFYGSGPAMGFKPTFWHIDSETGDATLYVQYPDGSKAHVIAVSASGDHITVRHSGGAGVVLTASDAIVNAPDGGAYAQISNGGKITLNGNVQAVGGLTAGGPAALPLAHGPSTVAALTAISTALAAIKTAFTAVGTYAFTIASTADPSGTATSTVVAALGTTAGGAMTAAESAITAAIALIPSTTASAV